MDISNLYPIICKIIDKKKCAINVAKIDGTIEVSVIRTKKLKRFRDIDSSALLSQLTNYLQA